MDSLPRTPNWRRYLRFWRADLAADVDDELRFHLEARTDDLIARGTPSEAAAAQALTEMGDLAAIRDGLQTIDRRVARRASLGERWSGLWTACRYAIRRLRASPMFTIAATLTLAITMGATASVFGLVDGVLLKAFPYREPSRVMTLSESSPGRQIPQAPVSPANYLDWRTQNSVFEPLAAAYGMRFTINGGRQAEQVIGAKVTPSYFSALGVTPVLGRGLAPDSSAGIREAVIGYGVWQRRFGGLASALGKPLRLDDTLYTIVGVMPPDLPEPTEVWTRLSFTAADQANWFLTLRVYGRLKPGVSVEQASTDMRAIAQRLAHDYPKADEKWTVRTIPLIESIVGDVRPALLALLAAAGCVLLIGTANLANLFLVRCLARERELGVRTALGATRWQLLRELVVEAGILGTVAGAIGIGGAVGGAHILRVLAPADLPRLGQVGMDGHVVAFCAATTLATVLIFGVLPAWRVSWGTLGDVLKEGGRGTGSTQQHWLQDGLVVTQVALALVLLTGAGLFVASFQHFRRIDPGFDPDGILTARITLPQQRYATRQRQGAFMTSVVEHLRALPGVENASASTGVPSNPTLGLEFAIAGDPPPDSAHLPVGDVVCVSPSYWRLMGIPLLRGRTMLASDDHDGANVVMVDERLAQKYFAGREVLGAGLIFKDTNRVVGVVAPVKEDGLAATQDYPVVYAALGACGAKFAFVAVRTSGDPHMLTTSLQHAIAALDADVPVTDIRTMNERMAKSIARTRFSTFLSSLFAVLALVLGVVGVYSVLAYIVSQRRREIAVRIALGARPQHLISGVAWRALTLVGVGIAFGSSGAWLITRLLATLFDGVSPHNPMIFVGAALLFALVALVAASIPAFRTTRISPAAALTLT